MNNFQKIKQTVLTALLTFMVVQLSAQKNYLMLQGGYALPATGYYFASTYVNKPGIINATSSRKGPNMGMNYGLEIGRELNSQISIYVGINYLNGKRQENLVTETSITGGITSMYSADLEANSLRLLPGLKITTNSKFIKPYFKFGAGIYLRDKMIVDHAMAGSSGGVYALIKQTNEYKCHIGFGYVGTMGINIPIKKSAIFIESSFYYQNLNYKSRLITAYSVGGLDRLSTLSRHDKELEFSKNYSTGNTSNPNEPSKAPAVSIAFSQISFNAGFIIPF